MTEQVQIERRAQYPCNDHGNRIALMEQMLQSIKATNEGLTTKMDLMLAQLTKVALLEEKHITQQVDVTRAHDKIGKLDNEFNTLARESREFMAYTKGQNKVLWALGAGVAALLVKGLFFAANSGMTP